jgi:hypothetical protein
MSLSVWYGYRLYLTIRPMPLTGLVKIFYRDGILYFVIIGCEHLHGFPLAPSWLTIPDYTVFSGVNAMMSLSQGVRE